MLKMGANGQLSVFEFAPDGVPVVVKSSGNSGAAVESALPADQPQAAAAGDPENDYSYLNGSLSPLFEGGSDGTQQSGSDAGEPGARKMPAADAAGMRESF